jgi:DNA-binding GntR family transcriptional regulator
MTAQRARRRDLVREAVIGRILDGTYPPGTRLKELALAAEFGVSQAPVREALREIEVSGLAVSEPYCGTRVLSLDAAELREACALKGAIEQRAAELAVPCPEESLDTLQAVLEQLRDAAIKQNIAASSSATLAFHRGIVVLSRSRTFLRAWDGLHWQVRSLAIRGAQSQPPLVAGSRAEVLAALRAGNGQRAGRLLCAIATDILVYEI